MRNPLIATRIARRLRTAEHAVDTAMIETTALIQLMIESRIEAGFAAQVGQTALLDMVRSLSQLAQARSAVVDGHQGLADVAEAAGMGWRMEGPIESKPIATPRVVPAAA